MNEFLVVRLDDNLKIIGVDKRRTDGLAHQLATRISDQGFRVRVIPPEESEDVLFLWDQVEQKRKMGFIEEYGIIPNGNRSRGEGARGIGRMIYEPLGIKLPPVPLSSSDSENASQKILTIPTKFVLKIGGHKINQ